MSANERYEKLETKTLPDGRVVYKSARPITVPVDEFSDMSFYASDVDRMDIIAHNIYGSAEQWWRIAAANRKVNGSLHVTPGTKLFIPR